MLFIINSTRLLIIIMIILYILQISVITKRQHSQGIHADNYDHKSHNVGEAENFI